MSKNLFYKLMITTLIVLTCGILTLTLPRALNHNLDNGDNSNAAIMIAQVTNVTARDTSGNKLTGTFNKVDVTYTSKTGSTIQDDQGHRYTQTIFTVTLSQSYTASLDGYNLVDKKYKTSATGEEKSWSTTSNEYKINSLSLTSSDLSSWEAILIFEKIDDEIPEMPRVTYVVNGTQGYTAYAYATDNVGVTRVRFPTWTDKNGQDDIIWGEGEKGNWTVNDSTYNYRYVVNISDHNNEYGKYYTDIYAFDAAGNQKVRYMTIMFEFYSFNIEFLLDERKSGTLAGYGSIDFYLNGKLVEYQNASYTYFDIIYGTKYEIKNVRSSTDKEFLGITSDSAALSGTITSNTTVKPWFRTKTWEDYASTSYASGSGTEESPYIIKTPQQLAKLAKDSRTSNLSGKWYKIGAPVDLSAHVWWPIGNDSNFRFQGNFDGSLYEIKNISTSVDFLIPSRAGLFGDASATIKNVNLLNGNIVGNGYSGAILGNGTCNVSNCKVNYVNVTSRTIESAGGIAGALAGTMESCEFSNGTINGATYAGGLSGWFNAEITNCSVINSMIVATNAAGPIYGLEQGSNGSISSTYVEGIVDGTSIMTMYGNSSEWTNWAWGNYINNGYPVQYPLYAVAQFGDSQSVYDRLVALGFTQG